MVHIILAGANGSVGSEILRQALIHPSITKLTLLLRRPLPAEVLGSSSILTTKLETILHSDFSSYPPTLLAQLQGADGCLWAIGVTGMGADATTKEYEIITRDYAVAAAKAFAYLREESKGKFVFCFISAAAADQRKGKAWVKAGAVRGDAEAQLSALRATLNLATYCFRPAPVLPVTPGYYDSLPLLQRLRLYLLDRFVIRADVIARAMIQAVLEGGSGQISGWEGKGLPGNENTFGIGEMKLLGASRVLAKAE